MKNFQKVHVQQHEAADCGPACLLSILRWYGGNASLERLRELSGTNITGSTLLGIYQAGQQLHLEIEGFEADIEHLKKLEHPAILHIVKEEEILHFVVCYGYDSVKDTFIISDPAEPYIQHYSTEKMTQVWQTKTLLLIKPTPDIQSAKKDNLWVRFRWMYDFTKIDLNILLTSLILGAFIAALGLSVAVFSQKLVDSILPSNDRFLLFMGGGLLLFLLLIRSGLSYLRQLFLLRQDKEFNIRILDYFYQTLLYLPKSFFDTRKTGDLIARMNDTARIQETISVIFSSLAIEVIMIIVSTTALFIYNIPIGIISLFWIPIFALIVYRFNKKIITAQREVMASYAMNESNYIDTIQGIGTVKIGNKEDYFSQLTQQFYTLFQDAQYKLGVIGLNFGTTAQIAGTLFTVGIIIYSSLLVFNTQLTVGSVMAVIQLIGMAMASVSSIALAYIRLQEAKVALDRMQEFTELETEFAPEAEAQKIQLPAFEKLVVQDLNFRFVGRPLLLKDVSFEVKKGEIIAILGESGCGKSTLLQILQRFYPHESGEISVNDLPINEYALPQWRSKLGVVPQQIKTFNASLLENIVLSDPEKLDGEVLDAFFEAYNFDTYFKKFPAGYATILGETGVNISGGQQQMMALARALYSRPELLLLDEATSAMDRFTEKKILDLLLRLRSKMGIVLVTHRIKSASIADRIYLIENGEIVQAGTHETLMQSKNFYSESILEIAEI